MSDLHENALRRYERSLYASRRGRLWLQAGKMCHWCGNETRYTAQVCANQATIDHVIPRCAGGSNEDDNVVSACLECNQRRNKEHQLNLAEGHLMYTFRRGENRKKMNVVALTGDEKRAIKGRTSPRIPMQTEKERLLEQRDAALQEIQKLRRQLEEKDAVIARLQTGFWTRTRRALAAWLAR